MEPVRVQVRQERLVRLLLPGLLECREVPEPAREPVPGRARLPALPQGRDPAAGYFGCIQSEAQWRPTEAMC